MRKNLASHRQTLLDLQRTQAIVRLQEAKLQMQIALENLEAARVRKEIAYEVWQNKLIEAKIKRQIAESKTAKFGCNSPVCSNNH